MKKLYTFQFELPGGIYCLDVEDGDYSTAFCQFLILGKTKSYCGLFLEGLASRKTGTPKKCLECLSKTK